MSLWRNRSQTKGDCGWCGAKDVIIEVHHIYRRSLRPDLRNDPKNKIKLCEHDHMIVSTQRPMELLLQRKIYPNPPKFRAQNDIDIKPKNMNKAKDILLSKARAFRVKAANKENEAKRLREQADQLEAAAKQLPAT